MSLRLHASSLYRFRSPRARAHARRAATSGDERDVGQTSVATIRVYIITSSSSSLLLSVVYHAKMLLNSRTHQNFHSPPTDLSLRLFLTVRRAESSRRFADAARLAGSHANNLRVDRSTDAIENLAVQFRQRVRFVRARFLEITNRRGLDDVTNHESLHRLVLGHQRARGFAEHALDLYTHDTHTHEHTMVSFIHQRHHSRARSRRRVRAPSPSVARKALGPATPTSRPNPRPRASSSRHPAPSRTRTRDAYDIYLRDHEHQQACYGRSHDVSSASLELVLCAGARDRSPFGLVIGRHRARFRARARACETRMA